MNTTKAEAEELAAIIRRRRPDLTIELGPIGQDWVVHLPDLPFKQAGTVLAEAESVRRWNAQTIRDSASLRRQQP